MRLFGKYRNNVQHAAIIFCGGKYRAERLKMLTEKRALLDHARRCRRVASETEHVRAAERLIEMAQEYEDRAASFDGEGQNLAGSDSRGTSAEP
jgi:hypothetical protein